MTAEITTADRLEEYRRTYSDFHKDAYGFRPYGLPNWTLEEWEAEFERLGDMCDDNAREEDARQAAAAAEFEATVTKLIGHGAVDRAMAVRWLHDAHQTGGDSQFLCYCLGLKYGYLDK